MSSLDEFQFSIFKDCIARKMLQVQSSSEGDADSALDDFSTYLATEAWSSLPTDLKTATFEKREELSKWIPDLDSEESKCLPLDNISLGFTDTLVSYGIVGDNEDAMRFLRKVIVDYAEQATALPPVWSWTRRKECEICEREVPLTYHHLIPRSTHEKARKKGWHPEHMLHSVAWLCR